MLGPGKAVSHIIYLADTTFQKAATFNEMPLSQVLELLDLSESAGYTLSVSS